MKKDLVEILLTQYRDRIQPSIPSEVQDIADDHGVTAREVCAAMDVALDCLEYADERGASLIEAFAYLKNDGHNGPFELTKTKGKKGKVENE